MDKYVMIVAGGIGTRMQANIPKQFLLIENVPVLMHTIKVFYRYDKHIRIIVVLPENEIETWAKLCRDHLFRIKHEVRPGGATRFHSVKRNLDLIPQHVLVAVHDGVRPLVNTETIKRCFDAAKKYGNAIPCVDIPETMRKVMRIGNKQVDRSQFKLVQTPQVFISDLLKQAYLQEYEKKFTDDAGVVENMNLTEIHIVEGNAENIKITYEKDISMAVALLRQIKNKG